MICKMLVILVLGLVCTHAASSQQQQTESSPAKSEILQRIKRLLTMLHNKEQETKKHQTEMRELISQRNRMLERRKRLEGLLQRSPGLRTLLKDVINKQSKREKVMRDDQCLPGLFYCRDESVDERATRRESLKKVFAKKQEDSKYCPPGFFYCPGNRDEAQKKKDRLNAMLADGNLRRRQISKDTDDFGEIFRLMEKEKPSSDHLVEVVSIPAAGKLSKQSDEGKISKNGEKLADDLVKSLHDTAKKATVKKSSENETNFDLKQLAELLKD